MKIQSRSLLSVLCVLFTFTGVAWAADVSAEAKAAISSAPPNIIFVMADDLGWGDVGFNGQEHIRTPHLDAMARDGVVFTDHYAGSTVCMPSRSSFLTGYHMGHASVRGNPRWTFTGEPVNFGPDDVTVAEELRRSGYRTAVIGKWGLAEGGDDTGLPLRRGFDHFFGYRTHLGAHHYYPTEFWRDNEPFALEGNNTRQKTGRYSHDLVSDHALSWLGEQGGQPFFLYLAYTIPHYELTVPKDSKEPYRGLGWPKKSMNTKGHYHHDAEGNTAYAGMVSRMDRDLGRVRQRLEELGLTQNTLVIFTSDNGPEYEKTDRFFNSNGPFRDGKRALYEGGIRVPMVAVWPGRIPPGIRSDHPSAFWDFLPTACDLAGIEPTRDDLDGISYLPALLGQPDQQPAHDLLYWEFNERRGPIRAARAGDWKAVHFVAEDRFELYNLADDPGEESDLASTHPEEVRRLRDAMDASRTHHPAFLLERHPRLKK